MNAHAFMISCGYSAGGDDVTARASSTFLCNCVHCGMMMLVPRPHDDTRIQALGVCFLFRMHSLESTHPFSRVMQG